MRTLGLNLLIVQAIQLTIGNFNEYVVPGLLSYFYKEEAEAGGIISEAEAEYRRPPYDFIHDSISDYSELLIQFGFATLFVVALPCSTVVALINNHFEMRGDAEKMLFQTRRVFPKGAQDIGTWQAVFEFIMTLSVPFNCGLVVFTMSIFDDYSEKFRFWLFIAAQWFLFSMQAILRRVIPHTPSKVLIQMERQDFIVSKLIDFVQDDDDDELRAGSTHALKMSQLKIHPHYPGKTA